MNEATFSTRRRFLKHSAGAGIALAAPQAIRAANKANNQLRVGVLGPGRGVAHVRRFAETSNVSVAYVCDVDESRLARGLKALTKGKARGVGDFHRILEDKDVDVISIATPNFWHSPAAILAMQAGKHVFCQKPLTLTLEEPGSAVLPAAVISLTCDL